MEHWIRRHQRACLWGLAVLAVALRALLAAGSPTPYGYVFDFYHEAIQKAWALGRLPLSTECWQCYHPPLFTLAGLPLYALGRGIVGGTGGLDDPALRFVMAVPLLAGAVTAWYGYRTLRALRFRGSDLLIGTALILAFPCLFISSYGLEADIVLTALMTAFLYHLLRYHSAPDAARTRDLVRLGLLAGLACATKYTGVIAPASFALVAAAWVIRRGDRAVRVRQAAVVLALTVLTGGWKYADNLARFGTPLFANGSAAQGFSLSDRPSFWRYYDFHTLRMSDLVRLAEGRVRPGPLTEVSFYPSVWTTLHAMAWSDMSLFSDPSRHGFYRKPYPRKSIPPAVTSAVLLLGLVPGALAIAGVLVTWRRRLLAPLAATSLLTMAVYLAWVVAQESWALKTKYILFLLPAYSVYALLGLRWLQRMSPLAGDVARVLLVLLLLAAHVYLLEFAWG